MTFDHEETEAADRLRVRKAASKWIAYLYSGEATDEGRAEFEVWLHESVRHADEFRRADQVWRDLALADAEQPLLGAGAPAKEPVAFRRKRRLTTMIVGAIAASLALFVSASLFVLQTTASPERLLTQYETAIGEIRTVTLADGSVVTLDTASAVSVSISDKERRVILDSGRAFFDVEPDAVRPFVVGASLGEARVLGTEFTVSLLGGAVSVAVLEGLVEVSQKRGLTEASSLVLQQGERVEIEDAKTSLDKETFSIEGQREWITGRLSYLDQPLGIVVKDVNRYRDNPILIGNESLSDLPVTMSLRVDQTDQFIAGLEATQPIRIQRDEASITLFSKDYE